LIRGAEDLLAELGIEAPASADGSLGASTEGSGARGADPRRTATRRLDSLPRELRDDAARVLSQIAGRTGPDLLAARVGIPLSRVSALLLELELAGLVRPVGGRYERTLSR
jgi:predicted Rossmann fold nucleotide-binding protein DprA/Smf involved in DNA uptake